MAGDASPLRRAARSLESNIHSDVIHIHSDAIHIRIHTRGWWSWLQGHGQATYNLAACYVNGTGVKRSAQMAIKLYESGYFDIVFDHFSRISQLFASQLVLCSTW